MTREVGVLTQNKEKMGQGPTILFTLFVAKNGHEDIIVDTFAIIKDTTRSLRGQAVFDDSKT